MGSSQGWVWEKSEEVEEVPQRHLTGLLSSFCLLITV